MRATLEKVEESRAVLAVEVEAPLVQEALERAYRKLARRVNVPGFRRGKAPRGLVERYAGREALWSEAVDDLVPAAYREAVATTGIDPVADPQIEIVQMGDGQPLLFRATVEVLPEVELPPLDSLEVPEPTVEVTPADVEAALREIQERYAELRVLEDGVVEEGRFVVLDYRMSVEGRPYGKPVQGFLAQVGGGRLWPEVEEALRGARSEERRQAVVTFPADHRDRRVAGRPVTFDIHVREVREKVLPPLDDQLAEAEGFSSLDALRADVENKLAQAAERQREAAFVDAAVRALAERVGPPLPATLVERRLDSLIEQVGVQLGVGGGAVPTELREQLRQRAEQDVRVEVVLEAVARKHGIQVDDAELQAEVDKAAASYGEAAAQFRQLMRQEANARALRERIRRRKAAELVAASARRVRSSA
ncbi:MAG: trigger factor [Clostridia bacterium]|nr:trigger factor [Clostridia bacterium]